MRSIFLHLLMICWIFSHVDCQSPYETSWKKDRYILSSGIIVGSTALLIGTPKQALSITERNLLNRKDINSFDRPATHYFSLSTAKGSDIALGIVLATPLTLLLSDRVHQDLGVIGVMYLESLTFAASIPNLIKGSINRYRPMVYNPAATLEEINNFKPKKSFFSGHTTYAFTSAVFLSTMFSSYFPDSRYKKLVWTSSLLAASSIGYMRYRSGAHFPTDILLGAGVGSMIGFFIPMMHRVKKKANYSLTPIIIGSGIMLGFRATI